MAEEMKPEEPMKADDPQGPIQLAGKEGMEQWMLEEQLVKTLVGWFGKWDSWRRPYETLWDEIYRLFMSSQNTTKTTTRAKIFIPVVFKVIENGVAKFINLIFNQEEFFEVVPVDKRDEAQARVIQELLLYQVTKANFFLKFIDFVKQLLLYGTSYLKVYWKVRREWVWTRKPIRAPITIMGFSLGLNRIVGWEEKKEYKVVERRPEVDVLDVLDVFPDPNAATERDGRGIFLRSWISIDELKKLGKGKFPVYANTDSDKLTSGTRNYDSAKQSRFATRGVGDPGLDDKTQVEILEFWGRYDLDGDGIEEECLITLGNRTVVLRAIPNPFHHQKRPVLKSTFTAVPLEWYGIGLVEPIIPLQHELNTLRRQRLDNVNLAINRMWLVNSLADVDIDTLVSTPNGIILTDDMQGVQAVQTPDVTQSAYNDAGVVQADIEEVTVPKAASGTPESGRLGRTARGAQLIIGQALEKFGVAAKSIEITIQKMLRIFHQLNLQFLDTEDVAREIGVVGHLFDQKITPEEIRADVMFKMVGISDMVNREAKINQIISFYGVFKEALAYETVAKLGEKVWSLMGFNPDDIQITPAPNVSKQIVMGTNTPQESQQMGAALQAQAQQNGAGAPTAIPGQPQA